jgi:hypothetical protein
VIVEAKTAHEKSVAREWLLGRGVQIYLSEDFEALVHLEKSGVGIRAVVAYNAFYGTTCQMHMASNGNPGDIDEDFIRQMFEHSFITKKREYVVAQMSSAHEKSLDTVRFYGCTEMGRIPKAWGDGSDMVILVMPKAKCKALQQKELELA